MSASNFSTFEGLACQCGKGGIFVLSFFFFFLHRFSSLLAYFLHFLSPNHSICASSTEMALGKPGKSFLVSSNIPKNILGVAHDDTEGFKDKTH